MRLKESGVFINTESKKNIVKKKEKKKIKDYEDISNLTDKDMIRNKILLIRKKTS